MHKRLNFVWLVSMDKQGQMHKVRIYVEELFSLSLFPSCSNLIYFVASCDFWILSSIYGFIEKIHKRNWNKEDSRVTPVMINAKDSVFAWLVSMAKQGQMHKVEIYDEDLFLFLSLSRFERSNLSRRSKRKPIKFVVCTRPTKKPKKMLIMMKIS